MQFDSAVKTYLGELDFDPSALKEKYLAERDKRIRKEGIGQYVEVKDDYAHYAEDPYQQRTEREPMNDHVEIAIIGGGFGGTWYWNRYPGAMCDVESYCYLPLLEELGYVPKHKYAFAPEILEHSKSIARHFDLYNNAALHTSVTALTWQQETSTWLIETDRGDAMTATYVAMANGPLSRPRLPGIPGITSFQGHTFHTSRWDYDYTGGDSTGNLTHLKDKRVGIIGTGATAVQCIPHLGEWAKELYVFQRTPSSIDVRNNHETDPSWAANLESGWQQARMDNFNSMVSGGDADEDLVHDGWTDIYRNLTGTAAKDAARVLGRTLTSAERAELMELSDYRKMNIIRSRVDEIVKDKSLTDSLKPWYRQFCKRPCFHDEYLPTYNRDNVQLVDTHGNGVDEVVNSGVVVDGKTYELDCLIYATGFEVGTTYTRRAGYDIVGKEGKSLTDHWADGLRTLQGLHTHGFPNCFFLGFTQTAITVNVPHALNEQAKHVTYMLEQARKRQKRTVEVTTEAEQAYVDEVMAFAKTGQRFYAECTPGYYNSEGQEDNNAGVFSDMHGIGPIAFYEQLASWRDEGNLEGVHFGN